MSASLYKLPNGESVFNYGGNLVYAGADGWVRAADATMEKALVKYGATPVGAPSSVDAVGDVSPKQIPRDGGLGGGNGGAATGTATPSPLGTAAAGSSTAAAHEDHVHAMPSANDVGAQSLFVPWSMVDNIARPAAPASSFTPANGTMPPGGFNVLLAQGAGTQTLDGFAYVAGDVAVLSPAIGTWVKVSGQQSAPTDIVSAFVAGSYCIPQYAGSTSLNQAGGNFVGVGTATARSTTLTAMGQNVTRIGYVGAAAAANTSVGIYTSSTNSSAQMPGSGAYSPPVYFRCAFSATDANGASRMLAGFAAGISSGAITTEISAITNMIAVGADSTDTYLSLMINGASGTATKIPLGINIPANTNGLDAVEVYLKLEGGASPKITWYVADVTSSGATIVKANGVVTSAQATFPAAGTALRHGVIRNSAANASVAPAIDVMSVLTGRYALLGATS